MATTMTLSFLRNCSAPGQWFVGQEMPQRMIDEGQLGALLDRAHETGLLQIAQIFCRGQPFGNASFLDQTNLAIRLLKGELDQIVRAFKAVAMLLLFILRCNGRSSSFQSGALNQP
jgi:hypothetical protein